MSKHGICGVLLLSMATYALISLGKGDFFLKGYWALNKIFRTTRKPDLEAIQPGLIEPTTQDSPLPLLQLPATCHTSYRATGIRGWTLLTSPQRSEHPQPTCPPEDLNPCTPLTPHSCHFYLKSSKVEARPQADSLWQGVWEISFRLFNLYNSGRKGERGWSGWWENLPANQNYLAAQATRRKKEMRMAHGWASLMGSQENRVLRGTWVREL